MTAARQWYVAIQDQREASGISGEHIVSAGVEKIMKFPDLFPLNLSHCILNLYQIGRHITTL